MWLLKLKRKRLLSIIVFGFTSEELNLLNHLFIIFLERISVDDGEQTYILLDKDADKSEMMFMYITCLYTNYKSMGEADLTFSSIDEIKDEVFDFVYDLNDMLRDSAIGNVVYLTLGDDALGDDGCYLAITKA